jgi:hypothetical protein
MRYNTPEANIIKTTGGFGSIFVSTSSIYVGNFYAVKAITDCVFLSLSSTDIENSDQWVSTNTVLYAGDVLCGGNISSISLSGKALLFKH